MKENFSCGNRLRELRFRAGLSQEELASRADLSTIYVGMIERGAKNPTVRTIEQLCGALNIDLCEFFCVFRADTDTKDEVLTEKLQQLPSRERNELFEIIEKILEFRSRGK